MCAQTRFEHPHLESGVLKTVFEHRFVVELNRREMGAENSVLKMLRTGTCVLRHVLSTPLRERGAENRL